MISSKSKCLLKKENLLALPYSFHLIMSFYGLAKQERSMCLKAAIWPSGVMTSLES
jgi:hypothetical protein